MANMYRVTMILNGVAGGPCYSTGYFNAATGTAQQAADAWRTFVQPVAAGLSSGATWSLSPLVQIIGEEDGAIFGEFPVTGASVTGTNTGENLPMFTQGLATWRTATYRGGRRVQGRTFVPDNFETQSDDGVPNVAYRSAINTRINALIADASSEFGIWSKPRDASIDPPVTARLGLFCPVVSGVMSSSWSMLRTRRS